MDLTVEVRRKIAQAADVDIENIRLEHPEVESFGDFSTNIALVMKGGRAKAEEIAANLKADDVIEKAEVAGPGFVNISIRTKALINVLQRVITEGNAFGKSDRGEGKTVIVDYSAPNIAKPFGIGHLRSTIIGQAIYNLYQNLGYKTIGDNHLGDWGTQFGKLLFMIDSENPEKLSIDLLEEMYVRFHQLAEKDNQLEVKAREWFKKLEDGDIRARELWKKCWDVSMAEFNRIYDLLNIKIDETLGESEYEEMMKEVIEDVQNKGLAKISDGATVVDIERSDVPLMLIKSDGATTYATRDLATIKYRQARWNPTKIIYEVGAEQSLHFMQVFEVARKLGYVSDDMELVHTKHGLYLGEDGKKFSTRKGKTIKLEGILMEAIERAGKLGEQVIPETAVKVGIGAIKYFDLKHGVQSDIIFNWEKMFELAGNSGPYLQYTYARTHSVAEKSGEAISLPESEWNEVLEYKPNNEEVGVLRWIYRFPEVVNAAAERYSPNLVCNYLFELAQRFNTFYNKHSILTPAEKVEVTRNFRLYLTMATGQIMANGLKILGIGIVEKM